MKVSDNRLLRLMALVASLAAVSCRSSATVSRRDGQTLSGRIERVGGDRIRLVSEEGGSRLIPRAEIADIDHPGNVAAVTGLGLLAWTSMYFVFPSTMGCSPEEVGYCRIFMLPVGITGAALSTYGTYVWGQSTLNARASAVE